MMMNQRRKKGIGRRAAFLGIITLAAAFFAGCGKEAAAEMSVTETAVSAETAADENGGAGSEVNQRQQYEDLMRENDALWKEYNAILQEISYYDVLRQDEIAGERAYKSAEEKLNETREERPLRFRPVQDFNVTDETEAVIPEIPEEELDQWIADLTEQNETIREQIGLIKGTRDALKERYGAEKE